MFKKCSYRDFVMFSFSSFCTIIPSWESYSCDGDRNKTETR